MTAIEVVVALAIFSVLLLVLTSLQMQFVRFDRETDLELFDHPQKLAVLERVRTDVQDSIAYPATFQGRTQSPSTLIVRHDENRVIVWVFEEDSARRELWTGPAIDHEWYAAAVPRFEVAAVEGPNQRVGVRLQAYQNESSRLAFDQVVFPRAR